MSKPWFLDVAQTAEGEQLRNTIRGVLGRELNDAAGKGKRELDPIPDTSRNDQGSGGAVREKLETVHIEDTVQEPRDT